MRLPSVYDGRNGSFFFASYETLRLVQQVISVPSRVPSLEARRRVTGLLKAILEAYPLPPAEAPHETPSVAGFSNSRTLNATAIRFDHLVPGRLTAFLRITHAPPENRERDRYVTPSFVAALPALTRDFRLNWSRSRASQIYEQDGFGGAGILTPELSFPPLGQT